MKQKIKVKQKRQNATRVLPLFSLSLYSFDWPQDNVETTSLRSYFGQKRGKSISTSMVFSDPEPVKCIEDGLEKDQFFPHVRIGHGLYTANLKSAKGKRLLEDLRKNGVITEEEFNRKKEELLKKI